MGQTTDAAKAFLAAAANIDDIPFAITSSAEVAAEHKIEGEAVLLLKTFDDGRVVLSEGITEEAVASFIAGESLPLVVDFNQETAQKIFSGRRQTRRVDPLRRGWMSYQELLG